MRPENRIGDEIWDRAEDTLRAGLRACGVEQWEELPGEGAFYGPKIRYHKDSLGPWPELVLYKLTFLCQGTSSVRSMSLKTIARKTPVMLHRAIIWFYGRLLVF